MFKDILFSAIELYLFVENVEKLMLKIIFVNKKYL